MTKSSPNAGCGTAFGIAFFGAFLALGLLAVWDGLGERGQGAAPGEWLTPLGVGTLFTLIGIGGMALVLEGRRRAAAEQARRVSEPERPWLWNEEWAAGRVAHDQKGGAILLAAIALAFIGLSTPAVLAIPEEWEKGNHLILVALLFPAAGLVLGAFAVRAFLQWRRFGHSELELQQLPLVPGHRFVALVHVTDELARAEAFRLKLSCVRRRKVGSGKNRRTKETTLWSDEARMGRTLRTRSDGGVAVPVSFLVPADAKPTSLEDPDDRIVWMLDVAAELPGVDYEAEFEVPVFRADVADLPADAVGDDPYESLRAAESEAPPGASEGVGFTRLPDGGVELFFPPRRHLAAAAGTLVGTFVIGAVGVGVALSDMPLVVRILSSAFIGLFALLIGWSAAWLWTGSIRTRANAGGLEARTRCLGFGRTVILPAAEIRGTKVKVSGRSGGRRGKTWHDVEALHGERESVTVGSQVLSRPEAERIAAELRRQWPHLSEH